MVEGELDHTQTLGHIFEAGEGFNDVLSSRIEIGFIICGRSLFQGGIIGSCFVAYVAVASQLQNTVGVELQWVLINRCPFVLVTLK